VKVIWGIVVAGAEMAVPTMKTNKEGFSKSSGASLTDG
jgi:hypothetical protein